MTLQVIQKDRKARRPRLVTQKVKQKVTVKMSRKKVHSTPGNKPRTAVSIDELSNPIPTPLPLLISLLKSNYQWPA